MEVRSYRDMIGTLDIKRGVIDTAKKVIIYGPEGIGKSTLASRFPAPLFLDVEGSTKAMQVDRIDTFADWQALRRTLQMLHAHRYDYQTIVIDTADWAERLAIEYVCASQKKSGIEDFGYGKGYTYVKESFAEMLGDCDDLINDGINVVMTAHAIMRKFEQPDERGAYDRWELKLCKQCAPMVKEWADMVLFCNYRTRTQRMDNGTYKVTGGERIMYTSHNPCWDAKNRYGLADELTMDYEQIRAVIEQPVPKPSLAPEPLPDPEPLICSECGKTITGVGKWTAEQIAQMSKDKFGAQLCMDCAKVRKQTA